MIVLGALVLAALVIAFWTWMRRLQRAFLREMADAVQWNADHSDPWERPRIVKVDGGVYDVVERGDLDV